MQTGGTSSQRGPIQQPNGIVPKQIQSRKSPESPTDSNTQKINPPKIAIFFLAFLPQFANPEAGNITGQLFLLGIIFLTISLIVFIFIASLAGLISQWLKHSEEAQVLLNRIAGFVFITLALRLATASR